MTNLPTGRSGKILAVGFGFLALVIVYMVVAAPLLALYQSQAVDLQYRTERADHLRQIAKMLPQLKAAAEKLQQKNKAEGDLLLVGTSDVLAAATIQSTLKSFVANGGGNLTSVDMLRPQQANGLRRIGIRVSFSTAQQSLGDLLRKVEGSRPVLFIDNFDVHSSTTSSTPDAERQLTVALDVYGFRL